MSGQPQELMDVLEERLMLEMRFLGNEISAQAAIPQAESLNQRIEILVQAIGDEKLSEIWVEYMSASSSNSSAAIPVLSSLVDRVSFLNRP